MNQTGAGGYGRPYGLLLVAILAATSIAVAQEAKPDRFIPAADWSRPHVPDTLIVGFRPGMAASNRANVHATLNVGTAVNAFSLIPADVVVLDKGISAMAAAAAYEANPNVEYCEPNYLYSASVFPNDTDFHLLWGLHNNGQTGGTLDADIDAPEGWDTLTGGGTVVVAVIDSGVDYNHVDLAANMWVNEAELNGTPGVDDDGNGIIDDIFGARWVGGTGLPTNGDPQADDAPVFHGTHVAGTLGAVGNNGIGITGVAWNVQIMALKFLNNQGTGATADAIAAIEYAVNKGAHMSNNSWGGGPFSTALRDAIAAAGAADQLFIAAAGNLNSNNDMFPSYPASYDLPNIISVGSTDHNDLKSTFSNFGFMSVDIGAPGTAIRSTMNGNSYQFLSGTSMATPHVTGVAALLRELHPDWTHLQIKNQILASADEIPALVGFWQTCGRLNLATALGPELPPFEITCEVPPPPNDECVDAICVSDGIPYFGSTMHAIGTDITTCTFNDSLDVWHRYTPAVSGMVTIDTCGPGTNYDTALAVFDSCGGVELACNDDACDLRSLVQVNMTAGETYYIRVSGWNGATGNYELLVTGGGGDCGPRQKIYNEDFEDGPHGYALTGLWHTTQVCESATGDHTTPTSLYFGIDNQCDYDTGQDELGIALSPPINLAGATNPTLMFNYFLGTEGAGAGFDIAAVFAIVNGDTNNPVLLAANVPGAAPITLAENTGEWRQQVLPLSLFTGAQVQILFYFDTVDEQFNDFPGFYVDDIMVLVDGEEESCAITVLEGPAGTPNPVNSGGSVQLDVTANGNGFPLAYMWSASTGAFDDPAQQSPIWTAPDACGGDAFPVEICVTISCPQDGFVVVCFDQFVIPETPILAIIEGPGVSASSIEGCPASAPLEANVLATLSCGASPIQYAWSDDCAGEFDDPANPNPLWFPPLNLGTEPFLCELTVEISAPGAQSIMASVMVQVDPCVDIDCALQIGDSVGAPNGTAWVPVFVENAPNEVAAFGVDIIFDPAVLTFEGATAGDLIIDFDFFDANEIEPGVVRVGGFEADPAQFVPIGASGELIFLHFTVSGDATEGQITLLCMENLVDDIATWIAGAPPCCGTVTIGCCRDGDVNLDCAVTPGDALLAFQHFLQQIELTLCQQYHADVNDPQPIPVITPGDALCIFQAFLQQPSCLDPFPQTCSCQD